MYMTSWYKLSMERMFEINGGLMKMIERIEADNRLTKAEAMKMLKKHGLGDFDVDCFTKQFGDAETYHIQDVRYFLGY